MIFFWNFVSFGFLLCICSSDSQIELSNLCLSLSPILFCQPSFLLVCLLVVSFFCGTLIITSSPPCLLLLPLLLSCVLVFLVV